MSGPVPVDRLQAWLSFSMNVGVALVAKWWLSSARLSSAPVIGRDSASLFVVVLPPSCSANDEAFAVYLSHRWDHLI